MIPLEHYTPQHIADVIKQSIIGQDTPARTVATAISAHLSRCIHNRNNPYDTKIKKDNLIVLGPTGTGKTETVRTVINKLNLPIPMAVVSCTALTNAGYKGRSVDDILTDLILDAVRLTKERPGEYFSRENFETVPEKRSIGFMSETIKPETRKINKETSKKVVMEMCNSGVIILDEFDKLFYSIENDYEAVYAKKLQSELLKFVEGGSDFSEKEELEGIDTTDILFVAMGAFSGLKTDDVPTAEDIVNYGFMEELVGRFPLICKYNRLSETDLYKILTTSDISPVGDFQNLFRETENELFFDKAALHEIAAKAYDINTGARALRTVMSDLLYPILYDIDGRYKNHEIRITRATVNGKKPIIKRLLSAMERMQKYNPVMYEKVMKRRKEQEK